MKLFTYVLTVVLFLSYLNTNAQSSDNANRPSTAKATYSNKLHNNIYSGFCYRVRRASDNAEAWIDFDATTHSVTANSNAIVVTPGSSNLVPGTVMSFATFYARTSCYVTTWFDQSGNGYDAIQTIAAAQPRIVHGGTIEELQYADSKFTQTNTVTVSADHTNAAAGSPINKGN